MKTAYLTPEGLNKAQLKLSHLKTERRQQVAQRLKELQHVDEEEIDFEYFAAKEEQAFVEGKIRDLEELIANAMLIHPEKSGKIELGSTVLVQQAGLAQERFMIVGPAETNPRENLISNESPLGQALLGRQAGEEIEVAAPGGKLKFKVLDVH
jgi:transcription elongation factor GreA